MLEIGDFGMVKSKLLFKVVQRLIFRSVGDGVCEVLWISKLVEDFHEGELGRQSSNLHCS